MPLAPKTHLESAEASTPQYAATNFNFFARPQLLISASRTRAESSFGCSSCQINFTGRRAAVCLAPTPNYAVWFAQPDLSPTPRTKNHPDTQLCSKTKSLGFPPLCRRPFGPIHLALRVNPLAVDSLNFFMPRVLPASIAKLRRLQPVLMLLPVFRRRIIPILAVVAL